MRLIDADALDVIGYKGTAGRPDTFDAGVIWALEKMDSMPTIDAVSVVRCRECRYYTSGENVSEAWTFCTHRYMDTEADRFCAWGQRREDGDA